MEGVIYTDDLRAIVDSCIVTIRNEKEYAQPDVVRTASSSESVGSCPDTSVRRSTGNKAPSASEIINSSIRELSLEEAGSILSKFVSSKQHYEDGVQKVLPIAVIRAMERVLSNSSENKVALENALCKTQLCFSKTKSASDDDDDENIKKQKMKHKRRMERLKLQAEETKYYKLTSNIHHKVQDDDITAKSMTYAASIGLNMIIAPLSFGCFMWFFGGGVMRWFMDDNFMDDYRSKNKYDISRVIIGVISGVLMLFIEMILFVIRTHEFDKGIRKKQKKSNNYSSSKVKPFGEYSSTSAKNYTSKGNSNNNIIKK